MIMHRLISTYFRLKIKILNNYYGDGSNEKGT